MSIVDCGMICLHLMTVNKVLRVDLNTWPVSPGCFINM